MGKTIVEEILLTNGQRLELQTSTRQELTGEKSTYISLNTDFFRIRIIQRISLTDLRPHHTQIGVSAKAETDDLFAVESLILALGEAVKFAKQLNENVTA